MALLKPNLTSEQLKALSAMWVKRWRDKYPEKNDGYDFNKKKKSRRFRSVV